MDGITIQPQRTCSNGAGQSGSQTTTEGTEDSDDTPEPLHYNVKKGEENHHGQEMLKRNRSNSFEEDEDFKIRQFWANQPEDIWSPDRRVFGGGELPHLIHFYPPPPPPRLVEFDIEGSCPTTEPTTSSTTTTPPTPRPTTQIPTTQTPTITQTPTPSTATTKKKSPSSSEYTAPQIALYNPITAQVYYTVADMRKLAELEAVIQAKGTAGIIFAHKVEKQTSLHVACEYGSLSIVVCLMNHLLAEKRTTFTFKESTSYGPPPPSYDSSFLPSLSTHSSLPFSSLKRHSIGEGPLKNMGPTWKEHPPSAVALAFAFIVALDLRSTEGWTPLHSACYYGHLHIVRYLLSLDYFSVLAVSCSGELPVHMLLRHSPPHDSRVICKCAEMMLQQGVPVNAQDRQGNTLLHRATLSSNCEVIRMLLKQKKINLCIRNFQNETVVHTAVRGGSITAIKLILEVASDPHPLGDFGYPETVAKSLNNEPLAEWLTQEHQRRVAVMTRLLNDFVFIETDSGLEETTNETKEGNNTKSGDIQAEETENLNDEKKDLSLLDSSEDVFAPKKQEPTERPTFRNPLTGFFSLFSKTPPPQNTSPVLASNSSPSPLNLPEELSPKNPDNSPLFQNHAKQESEPTGVMKFPADDLKHNTVSYPPPPPRRAFPSGLTPRSRSPSDSPPSPPTSSPSTSPPSTSSPSTPSPSPSFPLDSPPSTPSPPNSSPPNSSPPTSSPEVPSQTSPPPSPPSSPPQTTSTPVSTLPFSSPIVSKPVIPAATSIQNRGQCGYPPPSFLYAPSARCRSPNSPSCSSPYPPPNQPSAYPHPHPFPSAPSQTFPPNNSSPPPLSSSQHIPKQPFQFIAPPAGPLLKPKLAKWEGHKMGMGMAGHSPKSPSSFSINLNPSSPSSTPKSPSSTPSDSPSTLSNSPSSLPNSPSSLSNSPATPSHHCPTIVSPAIVSPRSPSTTPNRSSSPLTPRISSSQDTEDDDIFVSSLTASGDEERNEGDQVGEREGIFNLTSLFTEKKQRTKCFISFTEFSHSIGPILRSEKYSKLLHRKLTNRRDPRGHEYVKGMMILLKGDPVLQCSFAYDILRGNREMARLSTIKTLLYLIKEDLMSLNLDLPLIPSVLLRTLFGRDEGVITREEYIACCLNHYNFASTLGLVKGKGSLPQVRHGNSFDVFMAEIRESHMKEVDRMNNQYHSQQHHPSLSFQSTDYVSYTRSQSVSPQSRHYLHPPSTSQSHLSLFPHSPQSPFSTQRIRGEKSLLSPPPPPRQRKRRDPSSSSPTPATTPPFFFFSSKSAPTSPALPSLGCFVSSPALVSTESSPPLSSEEAPVPETVSETVSESQASVVGRMAFLFISTFLSALVDLPMRGSLSPPVPLSPSPSDHSPLTQTSPPHFYSSKLKSRIGPNRERSLSSSSIHSTGQKQQQQLHKQQQQQQQQQQAGSSPASSLVSLPESQRFSSPSSLHQEFGSFNPPPPPPLPSPLYFLTPRHLFSASLNKRVDVGFGHSKWSLVQVLLAAVSLSTYDGELHLAQSDCMGEEDAMAYKERTLPGGWTVSDLTPALFQILRLRHGWTTTSYLQTLGIEQQIGNLFFLGRLGTLHEITSSARSGSMFFRTADLKLFVKTIPPKEMDKLKDIIVFYYIYLCRYPTSLLCRLYGFHKLGNIKSGVEAGFLILGNAFSPDLEVEQQYDLKGSTIDRQVGEEKMNEEEIAGKDIDFLKLQGKLKVGPAIKARLLEQLDLDTRFLCSFNLTDYSLLVGVKSLKKTRFSSHLPRRFPSLSSSVFSSSSSSSSSSLSSSSSSLSSSQKNGEGEKGEKGEERGEGNKKTMYRRRRVQSDPEEKEGKKEKRKKREAKEEEEREKEMREKREVEGEMEREREKEEERKKEEEEWWEGKKEGKNFCRIISQDGQEVYYLGIIDIFTVYGVQKLAERRIKSLKHGYIIGSNPQISAMPAIPYRKRFMKFMDSIFA